MLLFYLHPQTTDECGIDPFIDILPTVDLWSPILYNRYYIITGEMIVRVFAKLMIELSLILVIGFMFFLIIDMIVGTSNQQSAVMAKIECSDRVVVVARSDVDYFQMNVYDYKIGNVRKSVDKKDCTLTVPYTAEDKTRETFK